jgi:hypothetical protein
LRATVKTFADALMSAEADAVCGAGYGERSPERVNSRNGAWVAVPTPLLSRLDATGPPGAVTDGW